MKVIQHVAQNTSGRRSAVPDEIANTEGFSISQQKRKLIEQGFGWAKTIGNMRQVMVELAGKSSVSLRLAGQLATRSLW